LAACVRGRLVVVRRTEGPAGRRLPAGVHGRVPMPSADQCTGGSRAGTLAMLFLGGYGTIF
jgi:hypothetical protein